MTKQAMKESRQIAKQIAPENIVEAAGLIGTLEVAEILGWPPNKVATYNGRGKLPEPIGTIGGRPVWTKAQIKKFKKGV